MSADPTAPAPRADQAARYVLIGFDGRRWDVAIEPGHDRLWTAYLDGCELAGRSYTLPGALSHTIIEAMRLRDAGAIVECVEATEPTRAQLLDDRAARAGEAARFKAALGSLLAAIAHEHDEDGRRVCMGCAATWDDRRGQDEWHEGELCPVVVARALLAKGGA